MSYITNILLCVEPLEIEDPENFNELNNYLIAEYDYGFTRLDIFVEGNRAMESPVFGIAINFCDHDELIAKFRSIEWISPNEAQLFIKREDFDKFMEYNAFC